MKLYLLMAALSVTLHISKGTDDNYGNAACSGVFVGPNEVLTARHCFRDNRNRQWVKLDDGKSYTAEIEAISKDSDLALVTIPAIKHHAFVKFGKEVAVTEPVYTVNSGDDIPRSYNQGIVCNIVKMFHDEPVMIMHNVAILGGASGSGLFNKAGKLIGINTRGNESISLAVNLPDIKSFIDKTHAAKAKKA